MSQAVNSLDQTRTDFCGRIGLKYKDQQVVVMGWVDTRRDHGGLVFVDLRDREGKVQVVLDPKILEDAKNIKNEYVVSITGDVKERPDNMKNTKVATGDIEIHAKQIKILSEAEPLPFLPEEKNVSEAIRLKYRYLEMRSTHLTNLMRLRHKVTQKVRGFLSDNDFFEVETPILYKSTPEGARDFLVPSRMHQGHFYALPQSPQTLKQLLMVGGIDKYFQVARCFRDEDLRADRQPEFTQLDIEMSFITRQEIMDLTEKLAKNIWQEFRGQAITDIPVMTYQESMDNYGNDKPDLRIPNKIIDIGPLVPGIEFNVFSQAIEQGGVVRSLGFAGVESFSRSRIDKLTEAVKRTGVKGLVWIKVDANGDVQSSIKKFLNDEFVLALRKAHDLTQGPATFFIVADDWKLVCESLSYLRLTLGKEENLIDESEDKFCWVVDFPLMEFDAKEGRWFSVHHPFTAPLDDGFEILAEGREKEYGKVLSQAYDFVCNGNEIAGGSLRIFNPKIQKQIFKALNISDEEVASRFGFFNDALKYGTPPHGGIAWGVDRLVMILGQTDAIRDVIAFPKTARGNCMMSEAPSFVDNEQLIELGIKLRDSVLHKS